MAIILVALIFSIFLSKFFPHIESAVLILHITLFVIFVIVLTVMAPAKSKNADVWALFLNEGGYESKGVSFFVGLITPVFAFTGADGAVHMSEEIRHASRVVPWALSRTSSIAVSPSPLTKPHSIYPRKRRNRSCHAHRDLILYW